MASLRHATVLLRAGVLLAGALAMSACGSSTGSTDVPGDESPSAITLGGTSWVLESYAGPNGAVPAEATGDVATLSFAPDGSFSGSTGCNRILGSYSQEGSSLTFAAGPMTLRACPEPVAAQESAIVEALPLVASFTGDGTLALLDADGTTLLTYAPGLSSLAGTSWQATGINNGKEAVVSQAGTEKVTATFGEDGTVSGSGGCNTYSGTYTTTDPDGITIGPVAATEMACPAPAMEIEGMYFAALGSVTTYQIEGNTLTLRDASGATQVAFTLAE